MPEGWKVRRRLRGRRRRREEIAAKVCNKLPFRFSVDLLEYCNSLGAKRGRKKLMSREVA